MITITTEEAIKELSWYTNQEFHTPKNREAHRMAIEALERNRWIPVGERLPKKSGVYLCYWRGHTRECKYWQQHGRFEFNGRKMEVTHWMPLPEPPGKEEKR